MKRLGLLCLLTLSCVTSLIAAEDPRAHVDRAMKAYAARQFAESAEAFNAAIAAGADDAGTLYNAACASALAGRSDGALDLLGRAVDAGLTNVAQIRNDPDFDSIKATPRFDAIVTRAEKAKALLEKMWSSPAMATPFSESLTVDERVAGLSRIWSEAKFNFIHFGDIPDVDWDALYLSYLPRVRAAESTLAYYRLLESFVAQLKDGHSGVVMPRELNAQLNGEPGVRVEEIEGRAIVTSVSDPSLHTIAVGMELLAVDGVPVRQYAEANIVPYIPASTPQDRAKRLWRNVLLGAEGSSVTLTLADAKGKTREQTVRRLTRDEQAKLAPAMPPMELRMIGKIAYIALHSFGSRDAADLYERNFAEIAKSDAMIIDLRRNGGGDGAVGFRILATLVDKPFLTAAWSTREYRPTFRAWGRPETKYAEPPSPVPPNGTMLYTKPVVVLTSAGTYSAAEDFAVAFDAAKRGTILGEPTGGSTGQPLMFKLPGGGAARVCTKHDAYPDGREFVGVGIQPQVVVRPTVTDLRAGRDTVLETALAFLRKQNARRTDG